MTSKLENLLDDINEISEQLLLALDIDIEKINNDPALINNIKINAKQDEVNEKKLLLLMTDRQHMITQLFEKYTPKQLSTEIETVNEMVLLNNQLVELSQSNKQMFALQITKLKKSNKIKDLYKKY